MNSLFPERVRPPTRAGASVRRAAWVLRWVLLAFAGLAGWAKDVAKVEELWALRPVIRPEIPQETTASGNPIDAFVAEALRNKGLQPFPAAEKRAWLRRVTMDLTGLPPSVEEQAEFVADESVGARNRVVDRLLASEQHGVRYGRHWLDVLRYTDVDEEMPAAAGIHYWRDWVIAALNSDLGYDAFARAQISGNRAAQRRIISAAGHLTPVGPRPEDLFASGFLARGATRREDKDEMLAMSAVETVGSTFMGLTMGCAKCHDHFYDPIKASDYYSLKAIFDPLVLQPVEMATPDQVFAHGRAVEAYERKLASLVTPMRQLTDPYHRRLQEERIATFPPDVQAAIRKPERARTAAEQKVYDDYYPIMRIDPPKIKAVMPPEEVQRYEELLKQINALKAPEAPPVFWTVREDALRAAEPRYVLTTGDPARPKKSLPVQPGFPFAGEKPELRGGRRESFGDWLTAPGNPLFARVAVNRIWAWHFGVGIQENVNDFGSLGGSPSNPKLLDWLASEFVAQGYSMKWLHRLIVTSDTYQRASVGPKALAEANAGIDPDNRWLWKFPLRRLEAEPIRDSVLHLAGKLDLALGGKSFDAMAVQKEPSRRTAYLQRGYRAHADMMPDFLQTFDAEDGRVVCPRRTQTVTAPQALWLMNDPLVDDAASHFGARLHRAAGADLAKAVDLGYQFALGRPPSAAESSTALGYVDGSASRLAGFAWLLFNLDEFLYLP